MFFCSAEVGDILYSLAPFWGDQASTWGQCASKLEEGNVREALQCAEAALCLLRQQLPTETLDMLGKFSCDGGVRKGQVVVWLPKKLSSDLASIYFRFPPAPPKSMLVHPCCSRMLAGLGAESSLSGLLDTRVVCNHIPWLITSFGKCWNISTNDHTRSACHAYSAMVCPIREYAWQALPPCIPKIEG
jgi:hypothetical protein